ncbi:jg20099 [Pararge aegeria aegeria]|uniref:Jg20099 protein n=1 Tax=Pararge aegeria aegeria TaxID=348720 RepID=A0A8S4QJZ0_9NEOP|nr:jg20099 [Pararge aegeria aegeria]
MNRLIQQLFWKLRSSLPYPSVPEDQIFELCLLVAKQQNRWTLGSQGAVLTQYAPVRTAVVDPNDNIKIIAGSLEDRGLCNPQQNTSQMSSRGRQSVDMMMTHNDGEGAVIA